MTDELNTQVTDAATNDNGTSNAEAKFTQADMDKVAGNRAKEARAAERKALLKELGFDNPDDPKVTENLKAKLAAAKQAEDEKKSAEEKALERIAQLEKERDEARAAAELANGKRIQARVDSKLEALARTAGALHPEDVIDHLRTKQPDKVASLLKSDESIDEKAAIELITEVKKARDNWFQTARGGGSPSMSGGATIGMTDKDAQKRASRLNEQIIRG